MQPDKQEYAEMLFAARTGLQGLQQSSGEKAILMNDLVQLIKGNLPEPEQVIVQLNQSLTLRRQYAELIKQLAYAQSASQVAASTNDKLAGRETDIFSLKFKRDTLVESQIYALLNIKHPTGNQSGKSVVLFALLDEHAERIEFPSLIDGRTQQLFEEDDRRLQRLINPNSEIVLMP